jgi:hypothetical protein
MDVLIIYNIRIWTSSHDFPCRFMKGFDMASILDHRGKY